MDNALYRILLSTCQENNPENAQAQAEAIREGFDRLLLAGGEGYLNWNFVTRVRKPRVCIRGCRIRDGDAYVRYSFGAGFDQHLDICLGCLSLALFALKIYQLPTSTELMRKAYENILPVKAILSGDEADP